MLQSTRVFEHPTSIELSWERLEDSWKLLSLFREFPEGDFPLTKPDNGPLGARKEVPLADATKESRKAKEKKTTNGSQSTRISL